MFEEVGAIAVEFGYDLIEGLTLFGFEVEGDGVLDHKSSRSSVEWLIF